MKAAKFGLAITLLAAWHFVGFVTPLAAQNSSFPPFRPAAPIDGGTRLAPPETSPGAAPMAEPRTASQPTSPEEGVITIGLHDGSRLKGKPVDFDEVRMKTDFGEVTIPIAKIEGIRVSPAYGKQGLGVLLANGDLLHGTVGLDTFKLETSFGEVTIRWQRLESIVMSPEWKAWVPDGRSWRLVPYADIERRVVEVIRQPHDPRMAAPTPYTDPAMTGPYSTPMYAPAPYTPYSTTPPAPIPDAPPAASSSSSSPTPRF